MKEEPGPTRDFVRGPLTLRCGRGSHLMFALIGRLVERDPRTWLPSAMAELSAWAGPHEGRVHLDLRELEHINAAGLRALAQGLRSVLQTIPDGEVQVIPAPGVTWQRFTASALMSTLGASVSVSEAPAYVPRASTPLPDDGA